MSQTITPNGLLVREYDAERRRWRAKVRSLQFDDLLGRTSIEPGVSMASIFDLVNQNAKLMEVLSRACYVDVAALHDRPRVTLCPLVRSDFCRVIAKKDSQIDEVLIEKHLFFADDDHEGNQTPDWLTTKLGMAVNAADWEVPLPLAESLEENMPMPEAMARLFPNRLDDEEIFSGVVNLPLRLRTIVHRQDEETIVEMSFTLWEILSDLYGSFGRTPAFWNTDQPRITKLEEDTDQIRKIFEDDNDLGGV